MWRTILDTDFCLPYKLVAVWLTWLPLVGPPFTHSYILYELFINFCLKSLTKLSYVRYIYILIYWLVKTLKVYLLSYKELIFWVRPWSYTLHKERDECLFRYRVHVPVPWTVTSIRSSPCPAGGLFTELLSCLNCSLQKEKIKCLAVH